MLLLLEFLSSLRNCNINAIVSLAMDDGREVGDGEEDEVGCGELDLVVLSLLDCHSQRQQVRGCLVSDET